MSQRVKVRRLSDEEGRQLQRIVRRGGGKAQINVVRYRRAMVVLASAGGNTVEVIARLVQTSPRPGPGDDPALQRHGDEVAGPSVGGWPSPPDND